MVVANQGGVSTSIYYYVVVLASRCLHCASVTSTYSASRVMIAIKKIRSRNITTPNYTIQSDDLLVRQKDMLNVPG